MALTDMNKTASKRSNNLEEIFHYKEATVFNDPIHGHVEVHPLCVAIIDTPEFQRLRYIKQLGLTSYVYPGGSHSRFEHCIGVGHLAGKFVKKLKDKQPELNINNYDVLCAEVAGLCHDLGHGPFSHTWEIFLLRMENKDRGNKWKHEEMSVQLFQRICGRDHIKTLLMEYFGEDTYEKYMEIVKQQINGTMQSRKKYKWMVGEEDSDKSYLYDIVANKTNNIDVDKWDYLSRDSHHTGFKQYFDHERLMTLARVLKCDDRQLHICFSEKLTLNIVQMFHTRWELHRMAYQHKVVKVLEHMLLDALHEAKEHFKVTGKDGKEMSLVEAACDVDAFIKLNDNILLDLQRSKEDTLKTARSILLRIEDRDLYGVVDHIAINDQLYEKVDRDPAKIEREIYEFRDENEVKYLEQHQCQLLSVQDIYVECKRLDYGDHSNTPGNPLANVYFYHKQSPKNGRQIRPEEVSKMFPQVYKETMLFCVCRKKIFSKVVYNAFQKWRACSVEDCSGDART